jgi:O-antigen/teichoic acid export membrane protein
MQGGSLAIPAILVAALYGPAAAGLFVVAQRVIGLPAMFAAEAVGTAWSGTAAEIVREDRGRLREPLKAITRTMLVGGGAVMVVVLLLGPTLFGPIFGGDWDHAGRLLLALAPLHFSVFAAVPAGQTLVALRRTDLVTLVSAGRLASPVIGVAGGHALGWSLTGALGLYAACMVAVSVMNAAMAWRLSGRMP